MEDWERMEAAVLDKAAALLWERGAPDFHRAALQARLPAGAVRDEDFETYFPDMSAVWRGLALVRGLEVEALGGVRARISNLNLRGRQRLCARAVAGAQRQQR